MSKDHLYHIKKGYQARSEPVYHDESSPSGPESEFVYQPDVYRIASHVARHLGKTTIIDIGCGCASKLVELRDEFSLVGIDFGPNIEFCRRSYQFGEWLEMDFENPEDLKIGFEELRSSIIVCGDVIEHLVDPAPLMRKFREWMKDAGALVLSTPDRNLKNGLHDFGPPVNPHHVREWTLPELSSWMRALGFDLAYAGLTRTHSGSPARNTILIVAGSSSELNGSGAPLPRKVDGFQYWLRVLRKSFGVWRERHNFFRR